MSRLLDAYRTDVRPQLMHELGYTNLHAAPRLTKIVLNVGIGEATTKDSIVDATVRDISVIAGQRPVVTRARKSIAAFRLRQGQRVGVKVTLRDRRMFEFFDRFVNVALPRLRDFRGVSGNAFDGRGNFSIGVPEQLMFPEIDYDSIDEIRGFQVTFVTSAKTDGEARRLLEMLGMPYQRVDTN